MMFTFIAVTVMLLDSHIRTVSGTLKRFIKLCFMQAMKYVFNFDTMVCWQAKFHNSIMWGFKSLSLLNIAKLGTININISMDVTSAFLTATLLLKPSDRFNKKSFRRKCRITCLENPFMQRWGSNECLVSTLRFPILIKWHLNSLKPSDAYMRQ